MIGKIYISGEIGVDVTLLDVIKQVKNQPQATEFLVKIDSIGGFVDCGDDIYNYLKNLPQPVTTFATKAYSIASKIFMAGAIRIVEENASDVILIHLPWMSNLEGNHSQIEYHLKDLKATEDSLIKFYAEALLIDQNTIQSLLTNETFLSSTQAIELGFATQTQPKLQAVAKFQNNNKEEKEESLMNKTLRKIDALYNKAFGIKNELILQDASGLEVIFPDLADGDTPEVDSKVTVDGVPAEGEFLMPDGSTIVAVNGSVTAINPKVDEEVTEEDEALAADGDDKDAIIEELQAKIEELEAKLAEADDTDAQDKMLAVLEKSVEKASEMEAKILALQKSIGSEFTLTNNKEIDSAVIKAKGGETPKFSLKRK